MKKFPLLLTFCLALQAVPALAAAAGDASIAIDLGHAPDAAKAEQKAAHKNDQKDEDDEDDGSDSGDGGGGHVGAAGIVVPVGFFVMVFGIVGVGYYTRFRIERQKHETLRLIVEKGGVIPPELLVPPRPRNADLRRGAVLSLGGVGIAVFFAIAGPEGIGLGIIPFLIGVGYLLIWKLDSRRE